MNEWIMIKNIDLELQSIIHSFLWVNFFLEIFQIVLVCNFESDTLLIGRIILKCMQSKEMEHILMLRKPRNKYFQKHMQCFWKMSLRTKSLIFLNVKKKEGWKLKGKLLFSSVELVKLIRGPWLYCSSKNNNVLAQHRFEGIFGFVCFGFSKKRLQKRMFLT